MAAELSGESILDRMVRAVEKVRERLLRATSILENAGVPYAVIGGNAVAAWVSTIDDGAVRNSPDVDILVRRSDFPVARAALEGDGFVYRPCDGLETFLDLNASRVRDGVHVHFACEKIRADHVLSAPDLETMLVAQPFRVLSLPALVRMKLTSFRRIDRVHLRDLIGVGLIDASWCDRLPPPLADRFAGVARRPGRVSIPKLPQRFEGKHIGFGVPFAPICVKPLFAPPAGIR